ncbi:hypothetical protein C2L80_02805 [Rubneribacter badeniensis]|uniref:Peptidase C31 domain-containing protein n=1 Tax=Rubneribacter badeniensis TaxID=2070688 RepID=A0A2K2U7B6_9ACTN|nr:hypothetical protein [Rubneribacter badeniensis]OUO93398.1 hypothetical protein B5F41_09390 [Gordonibacter sp. An232A]PNV66142.1 hypothetical protein C2L80_02805 [Rubneribacter badeniensis]CVH79507.1 hypothetical protein BN3658_02053 [Coriobacteriaceae bacterium CHKCI002]HJH44438.1 hypothetical protein [Rubneribacter badeniensis]
MKRTIARFLTGAALFMAATCLCGCASDEGPTAPVDAAIGVIETRSEKETSRIVFYDGEMNEVAQLPLGCATLGNIFYDPLVYEGSLFAIPQGNFKTKDGEAVLQVDLDSLATETHTIRQPAMNDVAASDAHVFTCNTLNYASYINRCRTDDGEVSSVSIEGVYVSKIVWHEGSLYAFGLDLDDDSPMILRYDENLTLRKSIDCSGCAYASSVYRAVADESRIYFCSFDVASRGQIGVLDTKSDTLSSIQLNERGASSISLVDGRLYVAHCDTRQEQGDSVLSVVDLETGSVEERALEHGVDQMTVTDGSIYMLDNWSIHRYDAESMEPAGSKPIEKMPGSYSYLSGLFPVK